MHQFLFYALIALIPTQLGFHFWPDWALVLGRRVDYVSPTIFLTDIFVVLLFVFWFIELLRSRFHKPNIARKNTIQWMPVIVMVFIFFFAVSNIWFAENRAIAFYAWVKILEFGLLGFYITQVKPNIGIVIRMLSMAVLYSSILAIGQFILQHSLDGIFWWLGERTFTESTAGIAKITVCFPLIHGCSFFIRPYATFPHPNVLGGFIAVVMPLLLIPFKNGKKHLYFFWVRNSAILLGSIALIVSFSRSAWIVGALGTGWILWMNKKPFGVSKMVYVLCVVFLALYLLPSFSSGSESVVVRKQLNEAAVSIWESAPVIGVGAGNFLVSLPHFLPSRVIYFLQPVHNIYLLVLSEIGILGYVLLALCVWVYVRRTKLITRSPLYISLCLLFLLGLVDHYIVSLQQGRFMLTLVFSLLFSTRPRW